MSVNGTQDLYAPPPLRSLTHPLRETCRNHAYFKPAAPGERGFLFALRPVARHSSRRLTLDGALLTRARKEGFVAATTRVGLLR